MKKTAYDTKKVVPYNPAKIEPKWQKEWLKKKTFETKDKGLKKMILIEFPYPSGAGLHMGHMRPFIAGDVASKYFKMQGFDTMYPIGWDAFGLPAENYAIKNKVHPKVSTALNIKNAKKQLQSWGTGYDWSREINTTDPEYYKWTQKLFLEFYKAGLAYEKFGEINWCPKDKTGLANEEVVDGKCDRCGAVVEKRNLRQWYLKITDYAEKLLDGLKDLKEWPEPIKLQQENWIGKSEGSEITFALSQNNAELTQNNAENKSITVFTTRADTLFGVTYLVLAPENGLVKELESSIKNWDEVEKYINDCKNKTDIERTGDTKEKTGVELKGVFAINSANNEKVPVWIADYVLASYGTGAVMAVPAHDERDFEFAKKYNLPIKEVVIPHFVDWTNPPQPGKNVIRRKTIHAVIESVDGSKVIGIKWKKYNWQTFVIGGVEDGENVIEGAKREAVEETGYSNLEFVKILGDEIHSEYFATHKDVNRYAEVTGVVFRLKSEQRNELSEEESNKHEILWIEKSKIRDFYKGAEVNTLIDRYFGIEKPFLDHGEIKNSEKFNGLNSEEVKSKITEFVGGKIVTKYKLRDWVFSRQRYWGEPIPLVHCPKCGIVPVADKDLPVKLPEVKNYEPTGTGESPLAGIDKWVNIKCPKCIGDQKKIKYLVFDFDGVIGDTFKANLQARIDIGWAKDEEESRAKMLHYFTHRPHHANGHNYSDEKIKKLQIEFTDFGLATKKHGYKLFESFIKEIKNIKNIKIAVISSGSKVYVHEGTKKSGLKTDAVLTCEDSFSKEEKLEFLAKKWKINIKDMYYFTDSSADVYELEGMMDKKRIIGCSWGYIGYDELLKALPENQILRVPKDIHKIFEVCNAKRETNTMPQWAGSSWYWLRYMDPKNKSQFSSLKSQKYWSPVDLYFGGMEHTTLHLLYSRFWNLFFYDRGLVTVKEPYKKRVPHGIILGPDGEKMSKSKGNVVNPDDVIKIYGADTTRMYMMFLGPHGASVAWNDKGIVGTRRFLERVFIMREMISKKESSDVTISLHKTIKKVTEDIETFSFNTAVSAMMIFVNTVYESKNITKKSFETFLQLLAPFAPHLTEELWSEVGNKKSIYESKWPKHKEELTKSEKVTVVVQVNGKIKAELSFDRDIDDELAKTLALKEDKIVQFIGQSEVKRIIVVKNRLINIVI